jgi:hypothetical protein
MYFGGGSEFTLFRKDDARVLRFFAHRTRVRKSYTLPKVNNKVILSAIIVKIGPAQVNSLNSITMINASIYSLVHRGL